MQWQENENIADTLPIPKDIRLLTYRLSKNAL